MWLETGSGYVEVHVWPAEFVAESVAVGLIGGPPVERPGLPGAVARWRHLETTAVYGTTFIDDIEGLAYAERGRMKAVEDAGLVAIDFGKEPLAIGKGPHGVRHCQ